MNDSYARRGYADRGYDDRGYDYDDRGYAEPGYDDRGYAELGYAVPGYDDPGYDDPGDGGYDDRGYPGRRGNTDRGYPGRRRNAARGTPGRRNPTDGQKRIGTGGVIVAVVSVLSAVLVIWGLYYAAGIGERHKLALAAAGCEPNLSPVARLCTTVFELNNQYKRIANPAVQQVNTDVAAYAANETNNLTAAAAALRAEVTVEKAFAKSLASFRFPPMVAPKANALLRAIQAQEKLNAKQALSSSLAEMRSFNGRVDAASATVRADLTKVRKALETPVTANEEP